MFQTIFGGTSCVFSIFLFVFAPICCIYYALWKFYFSNHPVVRGMMRDLFVSPNNGVGNVSNIGNVSDSLSLSNASNIAAPDHTHTSTNL
jgi:hypothetical protein